jgi:hypothetical protein
MEKYEGGSFKFGGKVWRRHDPDNCSNLAGKAEIIGEGLTRVGAMSDLLKNMRAVGYIYDKQQFDAHS